MKKVFLFLLIIPFSYFVDSKGLPTVYLFPLNNIIGTTEIVDSVAIGNRLFNNTDFDSLLIPLKFAGNLLLIEAIIDGQKGNLIFDSGAATGLVLNKTYFRKHRKHRNREVTGINGLIEQIDVIMVDSLTIYNITTTRVKADLLDLNHIENSKGVKILGFFGMKLLSEFEIVLDVMNGELQLFATDRKGNRTNPQKNIVYDYSQKVIIRNNVLFLQASVGGKELLFCLDTGAECNAISNTTHKKALNTVSITGRIKVNDAGSRKNELLYGTMNDFVLGSKKIENMKTVITDLSSLSNVYDVRLEGILGYEFLKHGKVYLNCKKRKLGIFFTK